MSKRVIEERDYVTAEANGINRKCVYNRWSCGMPIEEAITKPVNEKMPNGSVEVPEWVYQAAEKLGVSRNRTYHRIYAGWSEERAATSPMMYKKTVRVQGRV